MKNRLCSPLRCYFPELSVRLICDDIKGTVGALADVANTLSSVHQQVFLARDTVVLYNNPN